VKKCHSRTTFRCFTTILYTSKSQKNLLKKVSILDSNHLSVFHCYGIYYYTVKKVMKKCLCGTRTTCCCFSAILCTSQNQERGQLGLEPPISVSLLRHAQLNYKKIVFKSVDLGLDPPSSVSHLRHAIFKN